MDKCKIGLGFNVPPPYTGNFMPPKSDLVYPSLVDFVEVNESISESIVEKPTVETNEPKNARKENGAPIIKDWGYPQKDLRDKGVIDIGCSRHMTGNRSYLTDYKEIDGGFVAFGVAFLEKPTESEGFEEIVDFLNANPIKYALTVNPTVYLDKKKVIITESTIRRDLQLEDAEGTECLPTATIFEELTRMGGPTEHIADEVANEEHVPTQSNNPPLSRVNTLGSGENRLSLKELMDLYTKLSDRVLDLETTKTAQAKEIASLKKRVKKLERKRKSKPPGMKRLFKIGRYAQVVSFEDEGLGDQEDASKQGRKIADIDADSDEVEVEKVVSTAKVTTESATTTTVDELTLA
ncbi:hypothetical protein Tco_0140782 [Tanacetum coccineum]